MFNHLIRNRCARIYKRCSNESVFSVVVLNSLNKSLLRRPTSSRRSSVLQVYSYSSTTRSNCITNSDVLAQTERDSRTCHYPLRNFVGKAISLVRHLRNLASMEDSTAASAASCQHVRSDELCKAKWLSLQELTYRDPSGKERKWEAVFRTTKTGDGSDGVVIIPILKRRNQPDSVLLVNQYRPPLKAYSLEFPAGLIDKGEDLQQCAMRELKEETGYTGVPIQTSPGVSLDPGLANCTVNLVTAEIDGDEECNKNPQQQQDEGEFIEVICVPIDDLQNTLDSYTQRGVVVHCVLYSYAMAWAMMAKANKAAS